jgi:hypothetical protein
MKVREQPARRRYSHRCLVARPFRPLNVEVQQAGSNLLQQQGQSVVSCRGAPQSK